MQNAIKPQKNWVIPAILIGCSGVSILSTDLYTPSLPHLPELLNSDPKTVQLTMSLNVLAYAVAQLFHGPLSDRVGHRKLLTIGMLGFLVASIGCALAISVEGLLAGRVIQGFFGSVPSVVVILVIRSLYSREGSIQLMSIYGMMVGLMPAVGPLIGGYVFIWMGWQMNFYLLAFLAALMCVLVWKFLPDTGYPDPNALKFKKVASGYGKLLVNAGYLRYLFIMSCGVGALFTYVTAGAFVIIERLQVPTEGFGLVHGTVVIAYMAGSLGVGRFAKRMDGDRLLSYGNKICIISAFALILPAYNGIENLYVLTGGLMLYAFGMGFLFATGPICAMDAAGDGQRSSASALMGACQMGAGALGGLLVGSLYDGSSLPMINVMAGFIFLGAFGYLGFGLYVKTKG